MLEPLTADFYSREYFTDGTISHYKPYGPGDWADGLAAMVMRLLTPKSVLDVGCAFGFMVQRYRDYSVPAFGFDISHYAISRSNPAWCWQGDAGDPAAYRHDVDLLTATELPEHLVPEQARAFLRNAYAHADRALLLIALEDGTDQTEGDKSHINIQPMSWWESEARSAGWDIGDASPFDEDACSRRMLWSGRWLMLTKPASSA